MLVSDQSLCEEAWDQISETRLSLCVCLTWQTLLPADAAEAAKVARHESTIQRSEASSERRGRDDRNQDMRPGEVSASCCRAHVRTALLLSALLCRTPCSAGCALQVTGCAHPATSSTSPAGQSASSAPSLGELSHGAIQQTLPLSCQQTRFHLVL